MAALTIADELSEAKRTIAKLESEAAESADLDEAARREADHRLELAAEALGEASHRIESLAAALAQSTKG